jgi:multiple sugar transport system substrate-binding protein
MQLSRDQPMPLYYQLKTLLTEEILNGAYGTDGRLPTEHEFYQLGYGAAMTLVLLAIGAILSLISVRVLKVDDS